MKIAMQEAEAFISKHATGFEELGATRNRNMTKGLACRTADDGGDAIEPTFQREMIGNEIEDWDS
jgi:hypothetical protein